MVGEHALGGEAETEPADDDPPRVVDEVERGCRQLDLGGGLLGVHHEDAVDAQLERVGGVLLDPAAQHDLAALGLGPGHLDVLGHRVTVERHAGHTDRGGRRCADVEELDSVVIGAGQAGLSASYHLKRRGIDHVVLDANDRPGGAWQHRWDSLTMSDVHGVAALPDSEPPARGEERANVAVAGYFADYERVHDLPVLRPVRVDRVDQRRRPARRARR